MIIELENKTNARVLRIDLPVIPRIGDYINAEDNDFSEYWLLVEYVVISRSTIWVTCHEQE